MFKLFFNSQKNTDGVRYISNIPRSLSIMLDLVFLIMLLQGITYVMSWVIGAFYSTPLVALEKLSLGLEYSKAEHQQINNYYLILITTQIIQLMCIYFYIVLLWTKIGTTPGKFLFGVRILDADTFEKITFKQANIRFFSIILSLIPLGLGIIWAIFDKRSQTWHDKLANTVLVIKYAE